MNMKNMEALAHDYSQKHNKLSDVVGDLQREIDLLKSKQKHYILQLAADAGQAKKALIEAVNDNPQLFEKPKTQMFHGIKFGLKKQKGKTTFADEDKTIQLIRKLLPEEQAELMISSKESVHKPSVSDLSVADLKRLGITVEDASDVTFVKVMDGEVEKLVNALMGDVEPQEAA